MSEYHPSEEELVLHHYGEAGNGPARDAHLDACVECAAAFRGIGEALRLAPAEEVPARHEDYGRRVWAQLQPRLDGAASPRASLLPPAGRFSAARRVLPSHLGAWGALAASLVVAFWLGQRFPGAPAGEPVVRERILLVAVGDHLERSRMVLAEITNAAPGDANLASERAWAGALVSENRLYRQAAAHAGDAGVAGVLDDLERVLAEFANGPERLSARQLEDLRARIEARGLLFKVKVVEGQVRARARRDFPTKEIS